MRSRNELLRGGFRNMLLYALFGLLIYILGSFLISLIPHRLAFNYVSIEVFQAERGKELKYLSVLEHRSAGHYVFKDKLSCDLGQGLERIALAVTEGDYEIKSVNRRVPWTWREDNPYVLPEAATSCLLESRIIHRWFGVIPLTQRVTLEHKVD